MKHFKLVILAAFIALVSTLAAAQTDPGQFRRSSDTNALMNEFSSRQGGSNDLKRTNNFQGFGGGFEGNFRQWQMGNFNNEALGSLGMAGVDTSVLSRGADTAIYYIGKLCIDFGVNCSWLLNLSGNSFSSLASLSPEQIMRVSDTAINRAKSAFGEGTPEFTNYKRDVETFYHSVAGMPPAQRKQYLSSLDSYKDK